MSICQYVENVLDRESSTDASIDEEILDNLINAVDDTIQTLTNCDSALAFLFGPVVNQAFSTVKLKVSSHKIIFRFNKLDDKLDTIDDDENTKNGKLRELNVSTSFFPEDHNAIAGSVPGPPFYPRAGVSLTCHVSAVEHPWDSAFSQKCLIILCP